MAGYIGTKAVNLSTTGADIAGDADVSGALDVGGAITGVNATLSGGIYLGGTGAANLLDDVEEGTFTYSIIGSTSGGWTNRAGYTKGSYIKVGNAVTIQLRFESTSRNSPTGTYVQITGLPFTNIATDGSSNNQVQVAVNFRGNTQTTDSCGTYGLINNNTAVLSFFIRRSNSAYSFDGIAPSSVTGQCEGGVQLTYITS